MQGGVSIKFLFSFLLLLISVLLYFNFQITGSFQEEFQGKQIPTFYMSYEESRIEIGMIGDILLHYPLYSYDNFLDSFEPVKEELESIDFLLANQESLPAGVEVGLFGYPNFSSPAHIIRDLKSVGVDMISMANNHVLDQEEAGVLAAIQNMKTYDMPYMGAFESIEDVQSDRIFQVDGITLGFLSYTYGTNGHEIPNGKDYLVNLIDVERITKDIHTLKPKVDFVVVSMHWGTEYELEPNHKQRELAQVAADAGADIIFGQHPHVIQPYEVIMSSSGHPTHVFYSLGNFFSAQKFQYTNIGGIAKLEVLKKNINGEQVLTIENPSFVATTVVRGKPFKVHRLKDVESQVGHTDEWVQKHIFDQCNCLTK